MQYITKKLDGRYSHKKYFKYCVEFSKKQQGPLQFHTVTKWMIETYGYAAEIRDWQYILDLHEQHRSFNITNDNTPDVVNFNWSWTNGYNDLRIYIKGDKELSFFKLKWPRESK